MKPVAYEYMRAAELAEIYTALHQDEGDIRPVSGAQSLGPMLNLRLSRPSLLVDLRHVPALRAVQDHGDAYSYGAAITHATFEDGLVPDAGNGLMRHVAGGIAYRPVRNRGTIGGSVAHADPAADWISTLLCLDARLQIGNGKTQRLLPVDGFMLGGFTTQLEAGELLERIIVPKASAQAQWSYHKLCRKTGEFAKAIGAVMLDAGRGYARVVCGAIETTPIVLEQASALLLQQGVAAALPVALAEIDQRLAARPELARQMYRTAVKRALAGLEGKLA